MNKNIKTALLMLSVLLVMLLGVCIRHSWPMKVTKLMQRHQHSGTYTIKVWNDGKGSQSYTVTKGTWTRDKWGKNRYEADELTRSCAEWIDLKLDKFSLSPGEHKEIPFSLTIPRRIKTAAWCIIWITSHPQGAGQIKMRQKMGVKIYAEPRKLRKAGKIVGMKYLAGVLWVEFENTGNVELECSSWIENEEKIEFPKVFVLPGYSVVMRKEIKLTGELISVVVNYGGRDWSGGRLKR